MTSNTDQAKHILALIEALDDVIVIEDGKVIKNTLSDKQITVAKNQDDTTIKTFKSDNVIVSNNQKDAQCRFKIHVPKNHHAKQPVHLFFIQESPDLKHNVEVVLAQNAKLTYNEYIYGKSSVTVDFVSQIHLDSHAELSYHSIANMDQNTLSSIHRLARVNEASLAYFKTAQMGHGNTHQDTAIDLIGARSYGEIKTVALANEKQEAIIKSLIEHSAKETEGYIEQYGVATDESFLVFEGVGKIHKGMKGSKAHQHNKGVVLNNAARLDANPLLLIDEYDVEASHGAAIGQIDVEQLYYLMSRGLSEKDAQRLIIKGYLVPLETLMKNEHMQQHFQTLLAQKTD